MVSPQISLCRDLFACRTSQNSREQTDERSGIRGLLYRDLPPWHSSSPRGRPRAQFNVQWAAATTMHSRLIATSGGAQRTEERIRLGDGTTTRPDLVCPQQPFTSTGGSQRVFPQRGPPWEPHDRVCSEARPVVPAATATTTGSGAGRLQQRLYIDSPRRSHSDGCPSTLPRGSHEKGPPQGTWLGLSFEWNRSPTLVRSQRDPTIKPNPAGSARRRRRREQDGDRDLFWGPTTRGAGGSVAGGSTTTTGSGSSGNATAYSETHTRPAVATCAVGF